MAEFVEVCRQMLRNAEAEAQRKCGRRTYVEFCVSKDGGIVGGTSTATAEEIERTVMKWAAEHPEPKYPSWNEAWKQAFPDADRIPPCPRYFMSKEKYERICALHDNCGDCKNSPIPADIAEALHVKAIERSETK